MTSRERVLTALAGEEPDRVPVLEWSINRRVREALCSGGDPLDFAEELDLDGVVVYADYRQDRIDERTYRDEWGITLAETDEDYPVGIDFPLKEPDPAGLAVPDPCAPWRFEALRRAVDCFKGQKAIFFRLRDAYSLPRYLRGMENLMMDFLMHPDLVQELVKMSVDYYTRMAYCAMEIGADVFWTSDDYCDNRGPIMGVDLWRRFLLPGLKALVSAVSEEGYPLVKHCDGNILPILDDLADSGISCIDPIDVGAGVRLEEIKADWGGRLAIKGGVPIKTLVGGTCQEVAEAVRRCLRQAGPGGGYLLSSCSDITADVPPANFKAMLDTNRKWGGYPLQV